MAVFFDIQQLPRFKNAVITIGTFDGVHLGHRAILKKVVDCAKEVNGESILITFEPHPRKLLFPNQSLGLITPLHEKLQLITEAGIEHIVVVPFTQEFSNFSADSYIKNFLLKLFHPHTIIIGYDHRFGHDRQGNIQVLKQYAEQYHFNVMEIPAQLIDEAAVSSTKIRHALMSGHVQEATHMLGRPYTIAGVVIKGAQLGQTIGYPTANIEPAEADQLIPAHGIYAVKVRYQTKVYGGMLSIGYNPTVTDEKITHIEVNIFDFDSSIYGEQLDIYFIRFLRNEEKFASLDQLKEALKKDKQMTLQVLNEH